MVVHTHRHHRGKNSGRGGHYLLTVKGNQKTLCRMLKRLPQKSVPSVSGVDTSHGRRVRRTVKTVEPPLGQASPQPPRWSGSDAPGPPGTARKAGKDSCAKTTAKKTGVEVVYPGLLPTH